MHEFSLCRALLGQLETLAATHRASRISRVTLRVGPLSGAEPALLREAFPLASQRSPAADAELIIETTSVRVHCPVCNSDSETPTNDLRCPACGASATQLLSGDELLLVSADLQAESTATP